MRRFQEAFSLDPRSLAVMRIAYAIIILIDLCLRFISFDDHYTESGAFPLAAVFSLGLRADQFSLHALSGSRDYAILLFLFHAAAASLLLLGWRTRVMTVLCYLFAVSLHNRNFLVLNGGDAWMRIVLFWAIFLPWGSKFSLDSRTVEAETRPVFSAATCGLLLQVVIIYCASGLLKTGPAWRSEGSAVYLALHQLEWNSDLGLYFLYFPKLLVTATYAVLLLELVGPWFLVSPFKTQTCRWLSVAVFFLFHALLEICMELGMFPYVGMATLLGFLPSRIWQTGPGVWLENRLNRVFRSTPGEAREEKALHPAVNLTLATLLAAILAWNVAGKSLESSPTLKPLEGLFFPLGLNQRWSMFAPEPSRFTGWFKFEGVLADGSQVDLTTGGPLDLSPPRSSSVYTTQRSKRWLISSSMEDYKAVRPYLGRYYFRRWAQRFPDRAEQLTRVRGHYIGYTMLPNYEDPGLPIDYVYFDYTLEQLKQLEQI